MKVYQFYFEKLEVWKNAIAFSKLIYLETQNFPVEEKFGITNQIRRAVNSISANIAEGFARKSNKDKMRFLNVSFSTTMEVLNFLILSRELGFISDEKYAELRQKSQEIANQINALYNTLEKTV